VQDLTYGARLLRRSPMFTLVAVLSLALGIGANTAIFSLLDTVMLRSMPVVEPAKAGRVHDVPPPYGRERFRIRCSTSSARRAGRSRGFSSTAPSIGPRSALAMKKSWCTRQWLRPTTTTTLGVPAVVGQTFSRKKKRSAVAVISYAYWQRRFAGDPKAIGKTFRLHGTVFTIIGVTPKNFLRPIVGKAPEVTFPVKMDGVVRGDESAIEKPDYNWLYVMARLKPGSTGRRRKLK